MSTNSPLVTVILPAYNAECFVSEAVQSILEQTFRDWELIIINDGSTDRTREITSSFDDERIRLVEQKNCGVSVARNEGLSRAQGKYITFLDADDKLPPRSLEIRVDFLERNKNFDLVDGEIHAKDVDMKNIVRLYKPYYKGKLLPRLLALDSCVFFNVCYMFKKDILGDVKFLENMSHAEDLLFYIELASKRPVQYGYVNELVYIYRMGHGSAMSNLSGIETGYLKLIHEVKDIPAASLMDLVILRIKIAKILFLSGKSNGSVIAGIRAAFKSLLTNDQGLSDIEP